MLHIAGIIIGAVVGGCLAFGLTFIAALVASKVDKDPSTGGAYSALAMVVGVFMFVVGAIIGGWWISRIL